MPNTILPNTNGVQGGTYVGNSDGVGKFTPPIIASPATKTDVDTVRNELKSELKETVKELKKELTEKVEKFDDKIEQKQERTTEVLAIYITLFTFISVNVSIFQRVEDAKTAIWFMLLMTLCCGMLVSFLLLNIGKNHKSAKVWIGLVFTFVSAITLLGLANQGIMDLLMKLPK